MKTLNILGRTIAEFSMDEINAIGYGEVDKDKKDRFFNSTAYSSYECVNSATFLRRILEDRIEDFNVNKTFAAYKALEMLLNPAYDSTREEYRHTKYRAEYFRYCGFITHWILSIEIDFISIDSAFIKTEKILAL